MQYEPSMDELRQMKRAVRMNSVIKRKPQPAKFNRVSGLGGSGESYSGQHQGRRKMTLFCLNQSYSPNTGHFSDADHYYSASDHSDEELQDWSRGLQIPGLDDSSAPSNYTKVDFR